MTDKLLISVFGQPSISKGKTPLTGLPSRAAEALLIYLVFQQKPVTRETLAELLWADRSQLQALSNLRTILTALRRDLGEYLLVARETLAFNHAMDYAVDALEFARQLQELGFPDHLPATLNHAQLEKLRQALNLYTGDFLDGFTLREGLGFEEWVFVQRERFRQMAREAFRVFTHACLDTGLYGMGLEVALKWVQLDPYDEEASRAKIWLFMRTGQRSAALQTYQTLKRNLWDELGVVPTASSTDLYRRFQTTEIPSQVDLPHYAAEFIGRAAELSELETLLVRSNTPLITVTGLGGIGKTRLCVEAARSLADKRPGRFLNGVFFVPLDMVETFEGLITRLAESIRFAFHGIQPPKDQLLEHLRNQESLLILDNFEQLLDTHGNSLSFITELLQIAPGVKLLITSRERLNLHRETVFDLSGLDVPQMAGQPPESASAVVLFLQSVQRILRDFAPDEAALVDIVHICQLLGGVPLAIELASGWARQQTCHQIASQIAQDLDFLQSRYHDAPLAQRSLRSVFERSWNLLDEQEQHVFAQISVFHSGFTAEAARFVLGEQIEPVLYELVHKSLLFKPLDTRFEIHPVLRQYAAEKLSLSPKISDLSFTRHTQFYLQFLRQQGDGESLTQREAIRPEQGNLHQAWEEAARRALLVELEQTAGTLQGYFSMESHFEEGIHLFQTVIDRLASAPSSESKLLSCDLSARKARMHIQIGQLEKARTELKLAQTYLEGLEDAVRRARLLDSLAISNYYAGDYFQASQLASESYSLSEQAQSADGMAFALNFLGSCAKAMGNSDQARAYFERAVAAYRAMRDEVGAAMVLNNLGNLFQAQDNFQAAQGCYAESSAIFKAQNHIHGAATTLINAGKLALKQQSLEAAEKLFAEGLELKRKINDRRGEAIALASLGDTALARNARENAQKHLRQALELAKQVEDTQLTLDILTAVAALTVEQPQSEMAPRLLAYLLRQAGLSNETRQRVSALATKVELLNEWVEKDQELDETVSVMLHSLRVSG